VLLTFQILVRTQLLESSVLVQEKKERSETALSTGPQEPQSSRTSVSPGGQIGKAPNNRGGGEIGEEAQRKPYSSKGESKREADSGKPPHRIQGRAPLLYRGEQPLPWKRCTKQAKAGRDNLCAPTPEGLGQLEGVGGDCSSEHQQRPLQS